MPSFAEKVFDLALKPFSWFRGTPQAPTFGAHQGVHV